MKAIRVPDFGDPNVMKLEELPTPKPGAGQMLVRIHAAGVNPVDTYIRAGSYATKPALPYTPGADAAGVVEAIGEGVANIGVGDRVWIGGTVAGTISGDEFIGGDDAVILGRRHLALRPPLQRALRSGHGQATAMHRIH